MRLSGFLAVSASVLLSSFTVAHAAGPVVYPGCATPSPVAGSHTYYIDPVRGSMLGDGSQARPWHTLAEVVADGLFSNMPTHWNAQNGVLVQNNPKAPIRPGDTIYLMSGNHGSVTIQGYFGLNLVGYNNTNFITVQAFPGQTPILNQLEILGGAKWVFRGLTIESVNNTGVHALATTSNKDYFLVSLLGPHNDIILDQNNIQSEPNVSEWSISDWVNHRSSGILDSAGSCVSITNNNLKNIGFGIQTQRSNGVLIASNQINYFSDDGIDYGSSNTWITGNHIYNSVEDGDGFHRDGMQGQPFDEATIVSNVLIQNNIIVRLTDQSLKYPGFLQGIDTFDGVWQNIIVMNNIVVTDSIQGISYYGAHTLTVKGNILLGDGGKLLPCANLTFATCLTKSVVYDSNTAPGIVVHPSKANVASSNAIVTDNITTAIEVDISTQAAQISHNLCLLTSGKCNIGIPVNGKMLWAARPGTYGQDNVIPSYGASGFFSLYDPVNLRYNLAQMLTNPAL